MSTTLIAVMVSQVYSYIQTQMYTLNICSFLVYQLYLNKGVKKRNKDKYLSASNHQFFLVFAMFPRRDVIQIARNRGQERE